MNNSLIINDDEQIIIIIIRKKKKRKMRGCGVQNPSIYDDDDYTMIINIIYNT